MAINEHPGPVRSHVLLEGGGRLEGVAQIAEIRLEKERVEWTRTEANEIEVTGAINAYVYVLLPRTNEIQGQGLQIPFTHRVADERLSDNDLSVDVEELTSEHDFNPITGDFHHRVKAVIVLSPRPTLSGNLQARGETVMSQIATGERPPNEDDELPASTRPPSPEEFESMRQAVETDSEKSVADSSVDESGAQEKGTVTQEDPTPKEDGVPADDTKMTTEDTDINVSPDEKKDGGVLHWKPFPPPIS